MKNSYLIIIYFLMLIGHRAWGESVTKTVHFSHSELRCDTITGGDGQVYNKLFYNGLLCEGEPGCPTLPIKFISVPIPFSAENISLNIERKNVTSEYLLNKIFPMQRDIPTFIGNYYPSFSACDSVIYNSTLPFPAQNARIVSIPSIGDNNRFVRVAIYPTQYYPASNLIEFAEQINITVNYTASSFTTNQRNENSRTDRTTNIGLPFYEYCIITNNALKDSFTRLVAWRRQNGLNAGVVCIEDILNNSNIDGDHVSNLYDDAGKLRQYLQYAYNSGITKYVLFGGNDQVLPIRYGTGANDTWTKPPTPDDPDTLHFDYKIPTDFYFSELTSNWNSDNDMYLGEPGDALNYGGQLFVGRILCTIPSEVENYTNKLFRYELYPGNGNFSYLNKAFFQQADDQGQLWGEGCAVDVANALDGNFTIKIMQEVPGPFSLNTTSPFGHEVIDSMKANYGYVSWFGHGHPNGITTKSNSLYLGNDKWNHLYQPYGITSVEDSVPYLMSEDGNSLDCLGNKNYPMIAYSVSCTITPFDVFNEYTEFPNIGQSFTLGKDYGGPALIGNTRYGYRYNSSLFQKTFNIYAKNRPIGEAHVLARAENGNSLDEYHIIAHSSNVIGCPFIRLWTDIPQFFNASLSYISTRGIITGGSGMDTCYVCIRDINQSSETMQRRLFYPSYGYSNLPVNSLITLIGKNRLPQIMPLTIQNDTLQGTHHVIVKDVTCGKDVRNGTQGNVIFDENSDYIFETKGTFKLTKGVTIKQGAKLKVVPSEINY